jgi:uncharacterized protein (TIGR02391 family)
MTADDAEHIRALMTRGAEIAVGRGLPASVTNMLGAAVAAEFAAQARRQLLISLGADHAVYRRLSQLVARGTPAVEEVVDLLRNVLETERPVEGFLEPDPSFRSLLHPAITEHAYPQFCNGHYREAVLNSIMAVFELLRERTGLPLDGSALVTQALSVQAPMLRLADIGTESGRNEQAGFIQILQGAYSGIRNPKAHTLRHEPTREVAGQYMVFASLLARRIAEAETAA